MTEPITITLPSPELVSRLEERVRELEDGLEELRRLAITEPTPVVREAAPLLGLSVDQVRRRIASHREELVAAGAVLEHPQRVHVRRWREWERRQSK